MTAKPPVRRTAASLVGAVAFVFLAVAIASSASANAATTMHTGTCNEPAGRGFRATYTYDGTFVRVTKLESRTSAVAAWTPWTADTATTKSKLEWWQGKTFNSLYGWAPEHLTAGGFSYPWVTLSVYDPSAANPQAAYDTWWGAKYGPTGPTGIPTQPVYSWLNPRVAFSTTNDWWQRGSDTCDIYLDSYTGPTTATKRVAHIGDSISDQMTPKLASLNKSAGRRFFVDAQSGQSYGTMKAESRGIAAGIRDNGVATAPDVLDIALGTNDLWMAWYGGHDPWYTVMKANVDAVLAATANVKCRIVQTARDWGNDPKGPTDATPVDSNQALAASDYNAYVKSKVAASAGKIKLVDWQQLALGHRPLDAQPWFQNGIDGKLDRVHPNDAGLTALANAWLARTADCLAMP